MLAGVMRRVASAFLTLGLLASLSGCATTEPDSSASGTAGSTAQSEAGRTIKGATKGAAETTDAAFDRLERDHGVRLGVWAFDTKSSRTVTWRGDERFAYASTFKVLVCGALLRRDPVDRLRTVITYHRSDLVAHSPITRRHVGTGMTALQLCDAAIRYSDNTAVNLLLRSLGGPGALNAAMTDLGDTVTHADRIEPHLNEAAPGDVRDTSTPRALGTDLLRFVVGDALPPDKRAMLTNWLVGNTTGAALVRAAVPAGWRVGDKTGSGGYGTRNDIAVVWPPRRSPIVLAIMSTHTGPDADPNDAVVARAAAVVIRGL